MDIRKSMLTTAVAAFMSVGMAGQAAAYTSAGAFIEFQDLSIAVLDGGVTPVTDALTTWNFKTTNTAVLNDDVTTKVDNCSGTGVEVGSCSSTTPRVDAALAVEGTTSKTANTFSFEGPGSGDEYSYADSVITTAQLTGDASTNTSLIAETELLTTGEGNATSTITSTTGFEFTFTINDSGTVILQFTADPEMYAASDNPDSIKTIAGASIAASIIISQDFEAEDEDGNAAAGDGRATWAPDGVLAGCTDLAGGLGCAAEIDSQSLNTEVGISSDPAISRYSYDDGTPTFTSFRIAITDLDPGIWTFRLATTVTTDVTKEVAVPEPTTLLLLGAGLAGFGVARRRTRKGAV